MLTTWRPFWAGAAWIALFLWGCGRDSTGPAAGPYQVSVPHASSVPVGADSLADSVEIQIRDEDGVGLKPGVWLRWSANAGRLSRAVVQTDREARGGISWRLARPVAGASAALVLCVSRSRTGPCEVSLPVITHAGP